MGTVMEMILDKIQSTYSLSERDRIYLKFSLTALLYDISKIAVFLLFFSFMGKTGVFLFDMLLLILLRGNQGGLHLKHYTTCLLFSFGTLLAAIYLMPSLLVLPKPVMLFSLLLCIMINYYIGPIRSEQCRMEDTGFFKYLQLNAFLVVFVYLVVLYLFPENYLLTTGFWIIVFHSLQLAIAKSLKYTKERRLHHEKQAS